MYKAKSIKTKTGEKWSTKGQKIRRIIDSRSVALPSSFSAFLSLEENKTDLIRFLASEVLKQAEELPAEYEVIVSEGLECTEIA